MFIVAKKVHPIRLVTGCVALALLIGCSGVGLDLVREVRAVETAARTQTAQAAVKTEADRIAYLEQRGWIVSDEPVSVEDLRLPDTFHADYQDYLALQESQGFDLNALAGKTIKRYTYQVRNYPGLQENIWACLLVHDKRVVGGEVYSSQGDGFIQGLTYPARSDGGQPSLFDLWRDKP